MPFIGNQPALSYTSFAKQDFTTSATTSYTLDNPVANANELALFINFVRQEPGSYSASGTTLTLTEATSVGDDMYCVYLGKAVQTVNPPNASVGASQIVDGSVTSAKLSAGKVLQVVSATKTDTQSFSSSSFSDITGLSLSITPSSTSSKILVFGYAMVAWDSANAKLGINLVRNTTNILIGDAAGSRQRLTGFLYLGTTCTSVFPSAFNYLDAPSTTSATTYKIQASSLDNTGNVYVNRSFNDTDNSTFARTASTITAMEISA